MKIIKSTMGLFILAAILFVSQGARDAQAACILQTLTGDNNIVSGSLLGHCLQNTYNAGVTYEGNIGGNDPNGVGIDVWAGTGGNRLTLDADATINALTHGIEVDGAYNVLFIEGTINAGGTGVRTNGITTTHVLKDAHIMGDTGIYIEDESQVEVHGTVEGVKYGIEADLASYDGPTFIRVNETGSVSGDVAITMNGVAQLVSNWGTVSGNSTAIHFENDYSTEWFDPIVADRANSLTHYRALGNRGLIEATGAGVVAVTCAEDDLDCVPVSTIYGIYIDDDVYTHVSNLILNAGTISAVAPAESGLRAVAIHGGKGVEHIINYTGGIIEGDIETGSGDDVITLHAGSTFEGNLDMGRTEADPGGYDIHGQYWDFDPDFYLDENGDRVNITDANGDEVDYIQQDNDPTSETFGDEIYAACCLLDGKLDFDVDIETGEKVVRVQNNPNWQPAISNRATHDILVPTMDDPTTTIDESVGGTAYHVETATDLTYDSGNDGLVLADPRVLNVTHRIPDDILTNGGNFGRAATTFAAEMVEGYYGGDVTEVETLAKTGEATWTLGGNVTIDGSVSISIFDGSILTYGTYVESGALLIDGTLTSGTVVVRPGATIGGSGTIVTDPGLDGGQGGLRFAAGIRIPEARLPYFDSPKQADDPEGYAAWLVANDLPENFVREILGEDFPTFFFNSLDAAPDPGILAPGSSDNSVGTLNVVGNVHLLDKLTAFTTYEVSGPDDRVAQHEDGFIDTSFPDGVLDYDVAIGGAHTLRLDIDGEPVDYATQDVDGNDLTFPDGINDFEIGDDPATLDIVETEFLIELTYDDNEIEGREVVTSWGTVYEAELSSDGQHDRLNVTKSGATTAVVATMHPATEAIAAIPATEDTPAVPAVAAVDAYTTYASVPVPDGVAFLGGRLDIQLDKYLVVEPLDGEHLPSRDDFYGQESHVYDIVIAEGGIDGEFQDIGFDGGGNDGSVLLGHKANGDEIRLQVFKGFLEYMPDRVRITSIPSFHLLTETDNQHSIAHYIDDMTLYGVHQDPLQGTFAALGQSGDVPMALDWMSPEFFDPYTGVALTLTNGTVDTILDRVYGHSQGVSTNLTSVGYGQDTSAGASGSGNEFVFWAGGNWNTGDVSNDDGYIEYDFDTLVGYFGAEYIFQDTGMIGLVVSVGNTDVDYDASAASSGEVDHWSISGYASYFIGDKAHVTAGGGHGSMGIETTREDALDHVTHADYDGEYTYFFAEVSSTYQLKGNWNLTPSLDITHTTIKQDGFAETGDSPFALEVDSQSNKSLRGALKARVAYDWEQGSSHMSTYLQAGVAHEFKDALHVINARFVGDDGNFTVHGNSFHGTSALMSVGMVAILNDTWSIDAAYHGEFGSNYDNHGVSLNVNAAF